MGIDHEYSIMSAVNKKYFAFDRNVEEFLKLPNTVNVYWKDIDCAYIGCNDLTAEKLGLANRQEINGMKDQDWPGNPYAQDYVREDQSVIISKKTKLFYDQGIAADNSLITWLTVKTPLYNHNNIAGVFGISTYLSISNPSKSDIAKNFSTINFDILGKIDSISLSKPKIKRTIGNVQLTPRELETLHYLALGMSAKEIGNTMNISYRTVENFIAHLKKKFNCSKRSALIRIALKYLFS
jgi:DNA-binding CsgD family transcriptional regulator